MEFIAAALAALAFKSQSLERLQFALSLRRNGSRIVDATGPPAEGQQVVGIPDMDQQDRKNADRSLAYAAQDCRSALVYSARIMETNPNSRYMSGRDHCS